ncbi:MAG: hypothetical protein EPN89_08845 [Methylovulum sp.]|nr:MAG: hypothetical protein EPN89_08845 [Methylovulum sp.]
MTVELLWRVWAAALAVSALLIFAIDGSDSAFPDRAGRQPAVLPEIPFLPGVQELSADMAELEKMRIWGKQAKVGGAEAANTASGMSMAAPGAAESPSGALTGVYMVGAKRHVILFSSARYEVKNLAIGDVLPNGERVVAIERDRVRLQAGADGPPYWVHINRTAETLQ